MMVSVPADIRDALTSAEESSRQSVATDGAADVAGSRHTWVPATAFVALTIATNWSTIVDRRTESGDFAADSVRSLTAWSQADGVFSRWGYHHPGPVLFWLKWLGEKLFSPLGLDPLGAQLVGFTLLAAIALALLATAVSVPATSGWAGVVTFGLAFVALPDGIVMVPWGPVVGNWFLVLAVAGVAATVRRWAWGPPVSALGALGLLHLHVLFAPLTLAVLAALGWAVARRRPRRLVVVAAGVVSALMLVPLVLAVLQSEAPWGEYVQVSRGDDAGLFRFSVASGLVRVLVLLAPSSQEGGVTGVVGFSALFALLVGGLAVVLSFRGSSAAIRVAGAGALLTLAFLVGVSRMDFLTGETIGRALPVMVLVVAVAEAEHRLRRPTWFGLCAVTVSALLVATMWGPSVKALRREGDLRGTGAAEAALEDYAVSGASLLVIDHRASARSWSYVSAASTALLAARTGVPYCVVADRYPHWVEESTLCGASRPADALRVTFTSRDEFFVEPLP